MLDEVRVAAERLVAQGALDGGFPRVDVPVLVQLLLSKERLLADVAFVRFDPQVSPHVELDVLASVEQPPADFALQRVNAQMLGKLIVVRELLITGHTFMSSLCGHVMDADFVFF